MTILYLGPKSPLVDWLLTEDHMTVRTDEPLRDLIVPDESDFLISYNYQHKIPPEVLQPFNGRAINLHTSLLPWNRGSYPNFFSFLHDTPKGVTIHYLDNGFDTGDIIAQQEFQPDYQTDTLRTSYDKLQLGVQELFKKEWASIWTGTCERRKQEEPSTCHRKKDLEPYRYLLTKGWDTPVSVLDAYAAEIEANGRFWRNA